MARLPRSEQSESRKLYGRKKGRPLGKERADAFNDLLPALSVRPDILCENHDVSPSDLFDAHYDDFWLEIGFGHGEHVAGLMQRHPQTGFLAAEPFLNGVAGFLKDIQNFPEKNVRILHDDGMKLASSLMENSISGIFVLNPDPWPKKRHYERRIINAANLDVFQRILKPGGQLVLSTDVPDLADWMVTQTFRHPAFEWHARTADDWRKRPESWIPTRYELKRANHSSKMCYLLFHKKACNL